MITLPVKDTNGDEVGSYKLDPDDFALHVNKQLLHDVVVMYEANQRQGASKTKSRTYLKSAPDNAMSQSTPRWLDCR